MAQTMDVGRVGFFGFSRYQWLVFFVVWLGWALDATDFNLFSLVLKPAVTEVIGQRRYAPRSATICSGYAGSRRCMTRQICSD